MENTVLDFGHAGFRVCVKSLWESLRKLTCVMSTHL